MSVSDVHSEEYGNDNDTFNELEATEIVDAQILPGDAEKGKLLSMFDGLRREQTFCDVAFLCKGKLFRAHRVIVSGWSRWLRALLSEGSSEEVVHLDVFEPEAFSSVLDYMYGSSIIVTVENSEKLLKVIRRLELHGLEQSIWIFLMKAIDHKNCNQLHELADRYDCPPLKLAAWRYIQQAISGPTSKHLDIAMSSIYKGTGLTGPGEPSFYRNLTPQENLETERKMKDDIKTVQGIISSHSNGKKTTTNKIKYINEYGDEEDKEMEDEDDTDEDEDIDLNTSIDMNLTSQDYVNQWSRRLTAVYRDCAVNPNDVVGSDAVIQQGQQSILLSSRVGAGSGSGSGSGKNNTVSSVAPLSMNKSPPRGGGGGINDKVSHAGKPQKLTPGDIDWYSELKGFYLGINLPERLPFLDEILQANQGREEQMLSHLMMKYKRVIPESLANHLDTLQGFLETHSSENNAFHRDRVS
jgi:hypothetical protein